MAKKTTRPETTPAKRTDPPAEVKPTTKTTATTTPAPSSPAAATAKAAAPVATGPARGAIEVKSTAKQVSYEEIARAAYLRWERWGGDPETNWLIAERELLAQA